MSFVNLPGNDVWSQADIDNKVQALIRSRFSATDELKAARLARASSPSADELAFVEAVDGWVAECVEAGRQAKQDMALLAQVLVAEGAYRRLGQPEVEPVLDEQELISNQDALDQDRAERATAQTVLDAATPVVLEWVIQRNPVEVTEPEAAA